MQHLIYGLRDPISNIIRYIGYVGKSKLNHRLAAHIYESKRLNKCRRHHWIRALLRQNLAPTIELLEVVSEQTWVKRERYWIKKLACNNLVNSTAGGDGLFKPSKQVKAKMSGVNHHRCMLGKKHSAETLARMRAAAKLRPKGYKHSAESKAKMSAARKGKKFTAEHKAKISAALMGHEVSIATINAVRKAHLGRALTSEQRAKISKSLTGNHKVSKQGRANIRNARTGSRSILRGVERHWLPKGMPLPRGWHFANSGSSSRMVA